HGAFYYGIEPGLRRNIRAAEVIFLGDSMAQFGFSSQALKKYFNDRHIRFFVMGFGYGEWSAFPLAVWRKWSPSPKVLVINANPFFNDVLSRPAQDAIEGRPEYLFRLVVKMLFQRVHRAVCFIRWHACAERDRGTFRSAEDGQWNWIDPRVARRSIPVPPAGGDALTPEMIDNAKVVGEAFLSAVGVDRRCIVFTGTPSSV